MATVKIEYKPIQKDSIDEYWDEAMSKLGYEFVGSGYNFKTQTRDLCYEKVSD